MKRWTCALFAILCISLYPVLAADINIPESSAERTWFPVLYVSEAPEPETMPYASEAPDPKPMPYASDAPDPQTMPYPLDEAAYTTPQPYDPSEVLESVIPGGLDAYATTPPDAPTPDFVWPVLPGEPGRGTYNRPDLYWGESGYPGDIVYIDGIDKRPGENGATEIAWEIGIVGLSENREQELLDLFSSNCYITFRSMQYTLEELEECRAEIEGLMDTDTNIVGADIRRGYVVVSVTPELQTSYQDKLSEIYGDKVILGNMYMTGGVPAVPEGGTGLDALPDVPAGVGTVPGSGTVPLWVFIASALLLLCAGAALYRNRARFIAAAQTDMDGVVTHSPFTRKQVENAVRSSALTPPDSVLAKINETLDSAE